MTKQFFIDISGSISEAQVKDALNQITKEVVKDQPIRSEHAIHFIDLGKDFYLIKQQVKNKCDETGDWRCLYSDLNISYDIQNLFNAIYKI